MKLTDPRLPLGNDVGRLTTSLYDVFRRIVASVNSLWDSRSRVLFVDMLAAVGSASIPAASAPSAANFGPAHTPQRREWSFAVNEYVFIQPFHVNHDIKPGGRAYLHVHWSTNGTNTGYIF